MEQLVAQSVGFLALAILLVAFSVKHRTHILLYFSSALVLFTLHFALLDAWTAAVTNFVAALRGVVYFYKGKQKWASQNWWPFVFIGTFAGFTAVTWDTWISILPMIGAFIDTLALWKDNTKHLRLMMIASQMPWLVYNPFVGSIAGVIAAVFIIISSIVGLYRHEKKKS